MNSFKVLFSRCIGKWARDESGTVIVDFAVMFPIFLMFMLSSVEMGMMTFRQTMLERGLDMAVRNLRLGFIEDPTHAKVKTEICRLSGFLPDCTNSLRLEMQPVDPRNYTNLPLSADCIDKSEDIAPVRSFVPGGANQLMVMRLRKDCASLSNRWSGKSGCQGWQRRCRPVLDLGLRERTMRTP